MPHLHQQMSTIIPYKVLVGPALYSIACTVTIHCIATMCSGEPPHWRQTAHTDPLQHQQCTTTSLHIKVVKPMPTRMPHDIVPAHCNTACQRYNMRLPVSKLIPCSTPFLVHEDNLKPPTCRMLPMVIATACAAAGAGAKNSC